MKQLSQILPCYAADTSGVCSALYELGGMTVVHDASGCNSTYATHDEPRWYDKHAMIYISALTETDAVMGDDEKLISDVCTAAADQHPRFIALCGSPMPMMIGTDFDAAAEEIERRSGIRTLALHTNGTRSYLAGASEAFLSVTRAFVAPAQKQKNCVNILGATPLDAGCTHACDVTAGTDAAGAVCFGMDSTLDEIRRASECESLLVIAPSGLKAAKLLRTRFGIPYEIGAPRIPEDVIAQAMQHDGEPMLIVHQQFAANALRHKLRHPETADCATWFLFDNAYAQSGDFPIRGEEDLQKAAKQYRVIAADRDLQRLLPDYHGTWIDFPHYAVSARLINTNQ